MLWTVSRPASTIVDSPGSGCSGCSIPPGPAAEWHVGLAVSPPQWRSILEVPLGGIREQLSHLVLEGGNRLSKRLFSSGAGPLAGLALLGVDGEQVLTRE